MNHWRVVSERFPYLSLLLTLGGLPNPLDALLDTAFDGDLVVPADFPARGLRPVTRAVGHLADGTQLTIPTYLGSVRIGEVDIAPVGVLAPGDVTLVGTNLIRRFKVTLDHGERVIVEP